jgi:hypothetical protein
MYNPAGEVTSFYQRQNSQLKDSRAKFGGGMAGPAFSAQNYYAYDGAANRTGVQNSQTEAYAIGSDTSSSGTISVTINDSALSGGSQTVQYSYTSSDSLSSIAANLAAGITADSNLQVAGVNATANSMFLRIKSVSQNLTS